MIDRDGVELAADELEKFKDLPLVTGEDAGKNVASLLDLLKAEPGVAFNVASAARVGARRWDLHLKNGTVVMLPEQEAELALARLARAQATKHILDKNIAVIDLRLPDMLVVQPGLKEGNELNNKKTIEAESKNEKQKNPT